MNTSDDLMQKIVSLCKRRGFIFQGSEIYGGLANTWDYGPYGVELKNNIKRLWWESIVYNRSDIFGLDSSILMHQKVWQASGHAQGFSDKLVDCKGCKKRFKLEDLKEKKCPECGAGITEAKPFNLMFKTNFGATEDSSSLVYLRPETAQGIFVNFLNILDSMRCKLPFGVAQIGKSFRNEITPGNFTFRTREFEQMEIEYFVNPKEDNKWLEYWIDERLTWYIEKLGIKKDSLRKRPHEKDELAHYAKGCIDIEYNFPFGWSELEGIANRTDFDLKQHSTESGKELKYFDDITKERYFPHIIEPSGGVDRTTLAVIVDAYSEEKVKDETRVVLKLNKRLAPVKAAVLPLLKNRPQIVELARKIKEDLSSCFVTKYDDTAAIGKLYRRQDEIGTPFCITVDVQSLEDKKVTVRDRDTMLQERIGIDELKNYLFSKIF